MAVEIERTRRLFTADEFEQLAASGFFGPEERVELIRGEILEMSPIGPGHGAGVASLNKRLVIGVGDRAVVWVQGSARVALDSVPQPDLALLRLRSYRRANPRTEDVLLIVEVAESSLRYDRVRKRDLYAEAGVPEYWVVSVEDERVEIYRDPAGRVYRESRRVHTGDTIAPLAFPDVVIPVADHLRLTRLEPQTVDSASAVTVVAVARPVLTSPARRRR